MEYAKKVYKADEFGKGMLELCNASFSIAQVIGQKKICRCDRCIKNKGVGKILLAEKKREQELLNMTFQSTSELLEAIYGHAFSYDGEIKQYDVYFDNDVDYFTYGTQGKLFFSVFKSDTGEYEFYVWTKKYSDDVVFREGSTLRAALADVGYEFYTEE